MLDIFNNLSSGLGGSVNVLFEGVWEIVRNIVDIVTLGGAEAE